MIESSILGLFFIGLIQAESLKFNDDFKFGVATAAYQIEGAWNVNGKGENIWDRITHEHPKWVVDGTNGDIADNTYFNMNKTFEELEWLGVDFYRFSLSWTRLLPTGYVDKINPDGVHYYNRLIDGLIERNITPMVTIYHWDLPQALQELGGWPNVVIANYFKDYAEIAFNLFGDRVKLWITINEPHSICVDGYGIGVRAPGYFSNGIGVYLCGRTLLLAHAKAYHLYKQKFKKRQKGKVGITIDSYWYEPATESTEDKMAAEKAIQMNFGWWAHPIFSKSGNYPQIMIDSIDKNSKEEHFTESRLEEFSKKEIKFIRGTFDFLGLNHYSTYLVSSNISTMNWTVPSNYKDVGVQLFHDPKWLKSAGSWLKVVPWGFRKLLNWIKNEYDNPLTYITENGFPDLGEINDLDRINYHKTYLQALLEAIKYDDCNVKGYAIWTLEDNFEWRQGFSYRFGLIYVNISTPERTTTFKESARFYKKIIKTKNPHNKHIYCSKTENVVYCRPL